MAELLDNVEFPPLSAVMLAKLFVETYKGKLAYDHATRRVYVFEEGLWRRDRTNLALNLVGELVEGRCRKPKEYVRWCNLRPLMDILKIAFADRKLAATSSVLAMAWGPARDPRISRWLDERCEVGPEFEEKAAFLFSSWADFCRGENENLGSKKAFGLELGRGGFKAGVDHRLGRTWKGLRLTPKNGGVSNV